MEGTVFTIYLRKDADPLCYITTTPIDSKLVEWTIQDKCPTKKFLAPMGGSPILLNLDEGYERVEPSNLPSGKLRGAIENFYKGVPQGNEAEMTEEELREAGFRIIRPRDNYGVRVRIWRKR
jgi:hypothetical protein